MNTTPVAMVLVALLCAALAGCARPQQASSSDGPHAAILHRQQCGRCHTPPEPGTRTRTQVEEAAQRHRTRVRLTPEEWTAMIDYLAAQSN